MNVKYMGEKHYYRYFSMQAIDKKKRKKKFNRSKEFFFYMNEI